MRIEIRAKNFNLPDETERSLAERIERIAEIDPRISDASFHIEERGGRFSAEISLNARRDFINAKTRENGTVSQAIDDALAKTEKQVRRRKERLQSAKRKAARPEPISEPPDESGETARPKA